MTRARCEHGGRNLRSDGRCGICTSQAYDPLAQRIRYLPGQLERARRKVTALENEARRYGMTELLERRA